MGPVDKLFLEWERETFGDGPLPEWPIQKQMFAEYLAENKTKRQVWKMLCGEATGPCSCNCLCPAGIAWNMILEKEANA